MSTDKRKLDWIGLIFPEYITLNTEWNMVNKVKKLNETEFIFASAHSREWKGFLKYNVNKNKWVKFIEHPPNENVTQACLAVDRVKNRLYFCCNSIMMAADINTKKWHKVCVLPRKKHYSDDFENSCLLNVNGTIHLIGGGRFHLVWNDNKKQFVKMSDFSVLRYIKHPSLVYIACKQIILMIGGTKIWKYCLKSNKWQKINKVELNVDVVNTALSSNEEYIFMSSTSYKTIHILDIRDENNYKILKCLIKYPKKYVAAPIFITGGLRDEILVVGWIKQTFKTSEFKGLELLPIYMMQMIAAWYSQEELHWLNEKQHFATSTKHILSSLRV